MKTNDSLAPTLLELARDWDVSLADFSGPVSEEEIQAAEGKLRVVFPQSYRAFLRYFGAGSIYNYEIYGIPIDRLWGDVVTMNELAKPTKPDHLIKFTNDFGDFAYYLDLSQMGPDGECPVIALESGEAGHGSFVAQSFLEFLCLAREGAV